jgi:hypothetical protein
LGTERSAMFALGALFVLLAVAGGASLNTRESRAFRGEPFSREGVLTAIEFYASANPNGPSRQDRVIEFRRGDRLCLYAKIGSTPQWFSATGRAEFTIRGDDPAATLRAFPPQNQNVMIEREPRDVWGCWSTPDDLKPGAYDGHIALTNRLRSESFEASVTFRIEPSRSLSMSPSATTPDATIPGLMKVAPPAGAANAGSLVVLSALALTHDASGFRKFELFDPVRHQDRLCAYFEVEALGPRGRADADVRTELYGGAWNGTRWPPIHERIDTPALPVNTWGKHCFLSLDRPGNYRLEISLLDRRRNLTTYARRAFTLEPPSR